MPSKMSKKALDMNLITKKQYDNLPPALLEAISLKKLKDNKPIGLKPKKVPVKKKKK